MRNTDPFVHSMLILIRQKKQFTSGDGRSSESPVLATVVSAKRLTHPDVRNDNRNIYLRLFMLNSCLGREGGHSC